MRDRLDLERFLVTTVGKGGIRAKDTPNFVANRVGTFGMLATMAEADKFGLTIDVVDELTGFSEDDIAKIMGGNLMQLMKVSKPAKKPVSA